MLGIMAIGHRGTVLHGLPVKYPRKALLARLSARNARKVYTDRIDTGESIHIGYIVNGEWFTLYQVHEWRGDK